MGVKIFFFVLHGLYSALLGDVARLLGEFWENGG